MVSKHKVVIAGGGPVGMGVSLQLALRGIPSLLVERRTGLGHIPKGQNLTQRTLEHFHSWGIADQVRRARLMPKGYPIGEMTAYGNLMSKYWHAPAGREVVRQYYFQDNERLPQYQLEGVMRARIAALPQVEARFGWSVTQLSQTADTVTVTLRDDATGRTETHDAEYLVGCDGGHSFVRDEIGITRSGTDYDQPMVLAVFRSKELHKGLARFPERSTYRVMRPELNGFWWFFGRIDVGESWFFHAPIPPDARREDFDFTGLIHKAAGFEFPCQFDYVGFWDLRVAIADDYRKGRVLIAGDAAHTHPPYGGFGLNNGLEDASNLGWKLAAVLQGWGTDRLLDSYAAERRPVMQDMASYFIQSRIERDAAFFNTYGPEKDLAAWESAWAGRESDIGSRFQQYEPNYEASPIVDGPPGGKTQARGQHSHAARAGHHLTPANLSDGSNVFERLGRGFTLIALDAPDAGVGAFQAAARQLAVPLAILRDEANEGRENYAARFILVRPDQYVAWAGNDVSDAGAILRMAAARA